MDRIIAQIMLIVAGMAASAAGVYGGEAPEQRRAVEWLPPLTLNGVVFRQIEVARTAEACERGLMERTALVPDGGMCFVFAEAAPRVFWMKNTRIALDALFIDAFGVIRKIVTMTPEAPQRSGESPAQYEARLRLYACDEPVCSVLELPGGTAAALGLREGDSIRALSWRALHGI